MKKNIGSTDRAIRIVAAVVIGLLLVMGYIPGVLGTILGVFAIIFLATSVVGFCPLYAPFKIATRQEPSAQAK